MPLSILILREEGIEMKYEKRSFHGPEGIAYYKMVLSAWLQATMARDQFYLICSVVGLVVSRLRYGAEGEPLSAAGVAVGSFLVCFVANLVILEENPTIAAAVLRGEAGPRRLLKWCDRIVLWSFVVGVMCV